MHVISRKRLRDFWANHPDAETSLRMWLREAEHVDWGRFADVRAVFPSADQVGKYTIFNIGGNKYRLVVVIHFNRGKVFVRDVLTHAEYDRKTWKDD